MSTGMDRAADIPPSAMAATPTICMMATSTTRMKIMSTNT
jgi:hypothetical protein